MLLCLMSVFVDEFDDLLDRPRGVWRVRPSDEEALGLAFEQLQIHLTARLLVARDEAVEVNARTRSRVTCQRSLNSTP